MGNDLNNDSASILEKRLRNTKRILNHALLLERKQKAYSEGKTIQEVGVVELHATDRCDLQCFFCTYGANKKNVENKNTQPNYPFEMLDKISQIKPRAIVFAGGGEPLLYNDKGKKFEDIVSYFRNAMPKVKMGLITNGTRTPSPECIKELDWIRISMDTIDKNTFNALKGGVFEKRLHSIIDYIHSPIQRVGIGYLYNRFNFRQIPEFIKNVYDIVMSEAGTDGLNKVNLQFRPTCPIESCKCPSDNYNEAILMTPDEQNWWKEQTEQIIQTINTFKKYKRFEQFVTQQTNVSDICKQRESCELKFSKCYISSLRWTVRANGEVYPCVMKASNEAKSMGNILKQPISEILDNERKFYMLDPEYCSGSDECCRVGGVLNEIVEQNQYSKNTIGTDDPFF